MPAVASLVAEGSAKVALRIDGLLALLACLRLAAATEQQLPEVCAFSLLLQILQHMSGTLAVFTGGLSLPVWPLLIFR